MRRKILIFTTLISGVAIFVALVLAKSIKSSNQVSRMKLTSPKFTNNQKLPEKYTCNGEGISPPLEIHEVPEGTQSLVLALRDPDAPNATFIHWLIWNISPKTESILENNVPTEAIEGQNSAGQNHYFNPCPTSGQHRYIFNLYALDTTLTLPSEATADELEQIVQRHILGETTLTGIYP